MADLRERGTHEGGTHGPAMTHASSPGLFLRHYVEMVLAMAVGMVAFGVLFVSPLDPLGYRAILGAHAAVRELLMLAAMTAPMAAFMAYRGHPAGRTIEMVAGMAIPSILVVAANAAAAVPGLTDASLSLWSHVAMLLGMLAAMLCRRGEYSTPHHHGAARGQMSGPG